jgi:DNA polymerase III epsilon subunit-like protein
MQFFLNYRYAYFDLETTGLGKSTQICQIGAVNRFARKTEFSTYILPRCDVEADATKVNQLTKINGKLYYKNKLVESQKPSEAFDDFSEWISEDVMNDEEDKVILIAHNGHRFDAPVLINNMLQAGLDYNELSELIYGFVDTFVCLKHHFPQYSVHSLQAWKDRLNLGGVSHDALKDSKDLKKIVRTCRQRKEMSFEDFVEVGFKRFEDISLN